MARQLKLVRLDDFISDIDSIDLFAGGYSLAEDGYTPMVAPLGATSVHEVITLKIQGSSKDNLATLIQALDAKIKQVQWWIDDPGIERYQVWLRVQQDNETYERQAQILNVLPPEKVRVFQPEEYNNNYIGEYSIGIERTPFWEDPYPYPTTTAKTGISNIGGTATLSETINGDVPARLAKLAMYPPDATSPMSDYWIGWKTNRFGVAANFVPVWSIGDSAIALSFTDTSSVSGGGATYGTNMEQCTFSSDATLIPRCYNQLGGTVGANYADQRGSYIVLLRAKMTDTSIARARIASGFNVGTSSAATAIIRSRQTISGTSWKLYEMGSVLIPPFRIYNNDVLTNFCIRVDAERISGTGYLDMDCLILIPYNDGMIKLSSPTGVNTTGKKIIVFQQADDTLAAFFEESGSVVEYSVAYHTTGNWSLPANGDSPIMVLASQDVSAGSVKGKTASMEYVYISRWRTLRGSVT